MERNKKIINIKIIDWRNLQKGYFFGLAETGEKVFIHASAWINPDMRAIVTRKGFKFKGKIVKSSIISLEDLTKNYSDWVAVIEKTDRGWSAKFIDHKRTVYKTLKKYNINNSDFEESELLKELKTEIENDECSQFWNI